MIKKDYKTLLEEQRGRLDDFKNAMLVSNLSDSNTRQYFTEWFNHIVQKSIELDESCDDLVNKRIK
jgi:hypothetical protein